MTVAITCAAVTAAAAPVVPENPNITDVAGDANFANDQGAEFFTGDQGDHVGPASVDDRGDILAAWFSHTKKRLSAHILTAGPASGPSYGLRIQANPASEQPSGCTFFEGMVAGPTWQEGKQRARIRDICLRQPGGEPFVDGTLTVEDGPDGTSVVTMTFPAASAPMIETCDVIEAPRANTRWVSGTNDRWAMAPQLDNTKPGSDYVIDAKGGKKTKPCPTP